MKRVLLLLPAASYRAEEFLAACRKLGVEPIVAADHCHRLAPEWGLPPIRALHFDRPQEAAETLLRELPDRPDAVVAVDDAGLTLGALVAERLGLRANRPEAVERVRDKLRFRGLLREREFLCPEFRHLASDADPASLSDRIRFPAVVKPRRLNGSRGVVRADDPDSLARAVAWVRDIQARADREAAELGLIVEDFIPGVEVALEGLLDCGELTTLALFDKPDPLDGPYFEETIYVTPSRLPEAIQARIRQEVQRACRAAGLETGPVHAEARINEEGIWLLEVAPRSIGGLCGRVLAHTLGVGIEELILRHALGMALGTERTGEAAGVMMIPIPRRGIYRGVENLEAALATPGVTGIRIAAEPGQIVAPPPEGASYLGFIFSKALRPEQAELALRQAHRLLAFDIAPEHPLRAVAE